MTDDKASDEKTSDSSGISPRLAMKNIWSLLKEMDDGKGDKYNYSSIQKI